MLYKYGVTVLCSDLAVLSAYPAEFCASLYYGRHQAAPAYRMLFRLPLVTTAVNQPPVVIHKQFFKYLPSFTIIYNEVFAPTLSRYTLSTTLTLQYCMNWFILQSE